VKPIKLRSDLILLTLGFRKGPASRPRARSEKGGRAGVGSAGLKGTVPRKDGEPCRGQRKCRSREARTARESGDLGWSSRGGETMDGAIGADTAEDEGSCSAVRLPTGDSNSTKVQSISRDRQLRAGSPGSSLQHYNGASHPFRAFKEKRWCFSPR